MVKYAEHFLSSWCIQCPLEIQKIRRGWSHIHRVNRVSSRSSANIMIPLSPMPEITAHVHFYLSNFSISDDLNCQCCWATAQTLFVTGCDISFVAGEIQRRHSDEWVLEKDERETTQQRQHQGPGDLLQVMWCNEDRRPGSDQEWRGRLGCRWTSRAGRMLIIQGKWARVRQRTSLLQQLMKLMNVWADWPFSKDN